MIEILILNEVQKITQAPAFIQYAPEGTSFPLCTVRTFNSKSIKRIDNANTMRRRSMMFEIAIFGSSITETKELQLKALRGFEQHEVHTVIDDYKYSAFMNVLSTQDMFIDEHQCLVIIELFYTEEKA